MEQNHPESKLDIVTTLDSCGETITYHRRRAGKTFLFALIAIIAFIFLQSFVYYNNALNQRKISYFIDNVQSHSLALRDDINQNRRFHTDLDQYSQKLEQYARTINDVLAHPENYSGGFDIFDSTTFRSSFDSVVNQYSSKIGELHIKEISADSLVSGISELPTQLADSLLIVDNTVVYVLYGLFILAFGVLISIYRFHLKEASKYEHFLFGLRRIHIAAHNSVTGYEDYVKDALTREAFQYDTRTIISKNRNVESPVPGYLTSDLSADLLNKALSKLESKSKES